MSESVLLERGDKRASIVQLKEGNSLLTGESSESTQGDEQHLRVLLDHLCVLLNNHVHAVGMELYMETLILG
jgi:hypothetical protein